MKKRNNNSDTDNKLDSIKGNIKELADEKNNSGSIKRLTELNRLSKDVREIYQDTLKNISSIKQKQSNLIWKLILLIVSGSIILLGLSYILSKIILRN